MAMQQAIQGWAHTDFGSVRKQIKVKYFTVSWGRFGSNHLRPKIRREARKSRGSWMRRCLGRKLCKRSRVDWMKEGDKNTGYFQRKATWQKNNNFIIRLKDDKGTWG